MATSSPVAGVAPQIRRRTPEHGMQGSLFRSSIDADFQRFHADNPRVYELLRRFALQAKAAGLKKYGTKALFEIVRWHIAIETKSEDFKLCNNYSSRYARLLMEQEPELREFFETRTLKRW